MSTDPAVEAAAEALRGGWYNPPTAARVAMAEAAVAAARPIIEAEHADCICQRVNAESRVNGEHAVWIDGVEYRPVAGVRERIAADIEAERDDPRHDLAGSLLAYTDAARIARGQS